MKKFKVTVTRTSTRSKTFVVSGDFQEEAEMKAMEAAFDTDYSTAAREVDGVVYDIAACEET